MWDTWCWHCLNQCLPVILIGIFKSSFENVLRWMPQHLTDDKSTLVQVMAWCRQAPSHYLNQCWPRSPTPYGVTRPHWLNGTRKDREPIQFCSKHDTRFFSISIFVWTVQLQSKVLWYFSNICRKNCSLYCITSRFIELVRLVYSLCGIFLDFWNVNGRHLTETSWDWFHERFLCRYSNLMEIYSALIQVVVKWSLSDFAQQHDTPQRWSYTKTNFNWVWITMENR